MNKMIIEIVDLPWFTYYKWVDFPVRYVTVYQGDPRPIHPHLKPLIKAALEAGAHGAFGEPNQKRGTKLRAPRAPGERRVFV